MSDDCIQDVANMVKAKGGNRSQRRRLERSFGKIETIMAHTQKRVDYSAYKQYQDCLDKDTIHFLAVLAMVAIEDYHWKEDDTHDQVSSLVERVARKIEKFANMGMSTEDITKLVEAETGMQFVLKG